MKSMGIGIIIAMIFAGCGSTTTSNTMTCRASINDVVTEATTSGPITYDCATHEFALFSGEQERINGVAGSVNASRDDGNLSIVSDAKTGEVHRVARISENAADCIDTYISELPVDVSNAEEIENAIEKWPQRWQRDESRSSCPQWVRDLDPDSFDTVDREYRVDTDSGTAIITIKNYYE